MMSRVLALVGVLAFGLAPARVEQNQTETWLKRFPDPIESRVGGAPAFCVEITSSARVCDVDHGGQSAAVDGSFRPGFALTLYVNQIPTVLAKGRWGIYRGMFSVLLADPDADGNEELIVVDHVATSNGMAMTLDRISILANYLRTDRSLISFTVREYGTGPGTFVKRSGQPGLAILSTEWEQYESLDPHRGSGTYLVGRWFRYAKGRLQPEPGILARRLLNSFVDERSNDVEHQPYSYFANTKGRVLARDPSLGEGVALETLSGILERVTADDHGGADFELRLDDGRRITASFLNQSSHQPRERIDNVALAKLNRVLPQGVLPMAVVGDVTGRHVRLERYKDGKRENRVLWIE